MSFLYTELAHIGTHRSGTALLLTDNPYQAEIGALCAVNTFLSSSGGCVSALMLSCYLHYKENGEVAFDLLSAMNGALTGLVAVSQLLLQSWLATQSSVCSHTY